jgi:hypothetical protein
MTRGGLFFSGFTPAFGVAVTAVGHSHAILSN